MSRSRDDQLIWESYLSESPLEYSAPIDSINFGYGTLTRDKILNAGGDYLKSYKHYNVIELIYGLTHNHYILDKDSPVAHYSYDKTSKSNQTKLTWNDKNYPGLLRSYFVDRIIPSLKTVESDDMLTSNAFNFWKKLMMQNPELNFSINIDGYRYPLVNPSEIEKYKEKINCNNEYSRFIVSL